MQLASRRRARERRKADTVWTALTCGSLVAIMLLAVTADRLTGNAQRVAASAGAPRPAGMSGEDDVRTGSILIMPARGDVCDKHLFNNDTGRIWHGGRVSCEQALAATRSRSWSPSERVEAIRSGFR